MLLTLLKKKNFSEKVLEVSLPKEASSEILWGYCLGQLFMSPFNSVVTFVLSLRERWTIWCWQFSSKPLGIWTTDCFNFEIISLSEIFGFLLFIIPTPFRDSIWELHFLKLTLKTSNLMANYMICLTNQLLRHLHGSLLSNFNTITHFLEF